MQDPERFYIQLNNNGTFHFYGPFAEEELQERLDDAVGDILAQYGEPVGVLMKDSVAETININSREYWMSQLAHI